VSVVDETGAVPGLEGTGDPMWIYLTCYRVLKVVQDQRSENILREAQKLIEEQALKIEDSDLHYSFLSNVKTNQEFQTESTLGGTG
jgi:hypothetical protein